MKNQHLPIYGAGPVYGAAAIGATVARIWLSASGMLPTAGFGVLRPPLALLGALHGETYEDYCRRVNRCIPWPPQK